MMAPWITHWLDADGDTAPWRGVVETEIATAREAIARVAPIHPLDLLVQAIPGWGIPGIGLNGVQFRSGLVSLTVDPADANRDASLAGGSLRRIIAHEYGHCLRSRGGIGRRLTLADAFVSEGLADHFVVEVFGAPPMPWTLPFDAGEWGTIRERAPSVRDDPSVRHDMWLFSRGDAGIPRWAGYRLGYALVGAYLDRHPDARPHAIAGIPTAAVIADAWPSLFPEDS